REQAERRAEKKTTGIPHKDRSGIKVMQQEAAQRTGERQSQDYVLRVALLGKQKREVEGCDQCDTAGQAVHVVEQVKRIGQCDDPDSGQKGIERRPGKEVK